MNASSPLETPYSLELSELIERILDHLPDDVSALERDFVRQYYAKMPVVELERLDPAEAAMIARNSYPFFYHKDERVQIRAFFPSQQEQGWDGDYLVVEVHNDDHAFILDSLRAEFLRLGYDFVAIIHPVFFLRRDKKHHLTSLIEIEASGDLPADGLAESFIHFQLSGVANDTDLAEIEAHVRRILSAAEMVVEDFTAMEKVCNEAVKEVQKLTKQIDPDTVEEARDFLHWLKNKHYVFLGYVEYAFHHTHDDAIALEIEKIEDSQLGIFKIEDPEIKPSALQNLSEHLVAQGQAEELIEITKSSRKSVVHRPVLMDYVAIKRFDDQGRICGERRFIGMFTSMVYYQSAERIPYIRHKIMCTLQRANYDPTSHNGKALKAILEFYPRDELFQISEADLLNFSIGLMSLESKPEVRLFSRIDRYERFVSAMVYIPKERFSSYLREQIVQTLERAYHGKMRDFYTQLTDSPLARVHLIIETTPGAIPPVDINHIERQIANITNKWADALREALEQHYEPSQITHLLSIYADAFPDAYIEQQEPDQAVADIAKIEECISHHGLSVDLFKRKREDQQQYHLKIYTYNSERALSDMLPILENHGCSVRDVVPFTIKPKWEHGELLIRDFHLELNAFDADKWQEIKPLFEQSLICVWQGHTADDAFNALVMAAGLNARQVNIFRALSAYLRQIGVAYSNRYIARALSEHPDACQLLMHAFADKFSIKEENNQSQQEDLFTELDAYLADVENVAQDRIIRYIADLIHACMRTNIYQTLPDGSHKPYMAFKFTSSLAPAMPKPVPYAEIFVFSQTTEGIHLRGDAVARGGLRWSDRLEDYRTEVLGLMKAQMVKNAVIVPQGAKGGFVVKNMPKDASRDAQWQAGVSSYRQFLSGLLDITDNIQQSEVIPPAQTRCHDSNDPYLVVAADKGTATFSDTANEVAAEYDFWLGDAFASGGSQGYDHKAMGITARGAWVAVQRHFQELGVDIQQQDFTVVGIGDMSGDVFGNGMLLSEHIKLVAAFNHKHIFIDPTPDPAASFEERKRLFSSQGSQWTDYKPNLISKGGGVFDRHQKRISISTEIKKLLQINQDELTPDALIQAILRAPVDLLWNGGIGTYIKASNESHEDVGDRGNNAVRVDASELRCRVVGEGGNLGLTQRARIEYALNGGRINTDAIDNSAGVDCSDHEVNIKIALSQAVTSGKLATEARNSLLETMTEEVAGLVLLNNHLQTQAISIAEFAGAPLIEQVSRMMQSMEQSELLDRKLEFLPSDKELLDRRVQKQGLTRPELAVLLSYSKLDLTRELKDSKMAQSDYFAADLLRYFPRAMSKDYRDEILNHPLRPAIVATMITNSIVNRAGITFAHRIIQETGVHPCDLARAYVISRDAFKLREIWDEIERLGASVSNDAQCEMYIATQHFLENSCRWFLQNCAEPLDIEAIMGYYGEGIDIFAESFEQLMSKTLRKAYESQMQRFTEQDVPQGLARKIAGLEVMTSACDVVQVAKSYALDVHVVGRVYFELGAGLRLGWLRRCSNTLLTDTFWDQLAIQSIIRELYAQQRRLTADAVHLHCSDTQCELTFDAWYQANDKYLARYYQFIEELKRQEVITLPMLVVALRYIEGIATKRPLES